ncbi:hypothetical protein EGW08_014659, partial [Elysia chlorotica]
LLTIPASFIVIFERIHSRIFLRRITVCNSSYSVCDFQKFPFADLTLHCIQCVPTTQPILLYLIHSLESAPSLPPEPLPHRMLLKEYSKLSAQVVPFTTSLVDGRHVLVDAMTDSQVHEAYLMVMEAAQDGQGFGADEYVDEKEFREEIQDGYQFAVMDKSTGEMVAAFILAISKYSRGCLTADPFIMVKKGQRGCRLGTLCMELVVRFAKELGVGCLPMGGVLKDGGIVGTVIYYKDLRTASVTERG